MLLAHVIFTDLAPISSQQTLNAQDFHSDSNGVTYIIQQPAGANVQNSEQQSQRMQRARCSNSNSIDKKRYARSPLAFASEIAPTPTQKLSCQGIHKQCWWVATCTSRSPMEWPSSNSWPTLFCAIAHLHHHFERSQHQCPPQPVGQESRNAAWSRKSHPRFALLGQRLNSTYLYKIEDC